MGDQPADMLQLLQKPAFWLLITNGTDRSCPVNAPDSVLTSAACCLVMLLLLSRYLLTSKLFIHLSVTLILPCIGGRPASGRCPHHVAAGAGGLEDEGHGPGTHGVAVAGRRHRTAGGTGCGPPGSARPLRLLPPVGTQQWSGTLVPTAIALSYLS